jgi:uncharacterized membrane protein (DUF2068 family)
MWRVERLLAVGKIIEGVALCLVAFELVELVSQDLGAVLEQWVLRLHADPHHPLIATLVRRAHTIEAATIEEYAAIAALFGNLNLLQGVGFWLQKHWAEHVCAWSTAVLMPLEVHELYLERHPAQLAMLLLNAAIVWYLLRRIRSRRASLPVPGAA